MDANEVRAAVCQVLTEIQGSSGRSLPELTGGVCPVGGLEGFDSFNCVEAAMALSSYLGCEIQGDVTLFTQQGRHRTMDEIVHDLFQIVSSIKGE